jgi:hypothetical protein
MRWTHKALLQNLFAGLPEPIGPALYYRMQRHFGGLRRPEPMSRLRAGLRMAELIRREGHDIAGRRVLEIGTGHQLNLPIALWLCGAAEVMTVDRNRYLKHELIREDLRQIAARHEHVRELFGAACAPRLARLMEMAERPPPLAELLATMNIRYLAPADAAALPLAAGSIDFHVSFAVLEHIPVPDLGAILREGLRLLDHNGLFVHCIDFSDHFSHDDPGITAINFLQFSEDAWAGYAGNRYMFHNRLRVDEFLALLATAGLTKKHVETSVDERALECLKQGFSLHDRFRAKDPHTLATGNAWVVAAGYVES